MRGGTSGYAGRGGQACGEGATSPVILSALPCHSERSRGIYTAAPYGQREWHIAGSARRKPSVMPARGMRYDWGMP